MMSFGGFLFQNRIEEGFVALIGLSERSVWCDMMTDYRNEPFEETEG